jgi:hypothetical protein
VSTWHSLKSLLGEPPPRPRKPVERSPTRAKPTTKKTPRKPGESAASSSGKGQPKPKLFSKKGRVEVSATRQKSRLDIAWSHDAPEIDQWLVVVRHQHDELTRRNLTGNIRRVTIDQLPTDTGSLAVRIFGLARESVVVLGSTTVAH